MNKFLILSQSKELTILGNVISIGRRNPIQVIGEKLEELIKEKNITVEELTKALEVNKNVVNRLINNEEIPKKEMLDKIVKYFELEEDYFQDKELNNVIITDNNIVVGKYSTNERALQVKKELDSIIIDNLSNNVAVLVMPAE